MFEMKNVVVSKAEPKVSPWKEKFFIKFFFKLEGTEEPKMGQFLAANKGESEQIIGKLKGGEVVSIAVDPEEKTDSFDKKYFNCALSIPQKAQGGWGGGKPKGYSGQIFSGTEWLVLQASQIKAYKEIFENSFTEATPDQIVESVRSAVSQANIMLSNNIWKP